MDAEPLRPPYHPAHVDPRDGWDHRRFVLCWEHKATGLRGRSTPEVTPMCPGEAELWLAGFHREDHENVYWFEPIEEET